LVPALIPVPASVLVPGIKRSLKYEIDTGTLVLKGIREEEQNKQFHVKNNLLPCSFNKNMSKRNFNI
jgi:hypothetical protein